MRNLRFALLPLVLLSAPVHAAQLVALDLQPTGGVQPQLTASLTPILIAEVARHEGISVVSQADVRALLEHEANRQAMGCSETSCMTEIAGTLGAELLLSSTLGRVGETWVVSLTLIRVETAQAFRRATGQQKGSEEAAAQAVVAAISNLFRDGLPADVQGPVAMSRRGFSAALLGHAKAVLDPKQDPKASRRRIIADLVNTELDYDANPKIEMLDLAIRRGIGAIDRDLLLARDAKDLERYLEGRAQWLVINHDLQRVKEIRTRARERGMVPTTSALRFEDPEPMDRPAPDDIAAYFKAQQAGPRKIVEQALRAYQKRDASTFLSLWAKDADYSAKRAIKEGPDEDKRYEYTYDLLPVHAHSPSLLKNGIEVLLEKKEVVVFLRRYRKGKIDDERRVFLQQDGNSWKIRSW